MAGRQVAVDVVVDLPARVVDDDRIRPVDLFLELVEVVDRAGLHEGLAGRHDVAGFGGADVHVVLQVDQAADNAIGQVVRVLAVCPDRGERVAAVAVGRHVLVDQIALGHDGAAHLHVDAVRDHGVAAGDFVVLAAGGRVGDFAAELAALDAWDIGRDAIPCLDQPHALPGVVEGVVVSDAAELVLGAVHGIVAHEAAGVEVERAGRGERELLLPIREPSLGDIEVDPLRAEDIAGVAEVHLGRRTVPEHVAPGFEARVDRLRPAVVLPLVFKPADTADHGLAERAAAVELQQVGVAEVFHQVGLQFGGAGAFLAAREHLAVDACTLLGAGDPVDGGRDDVEDERVLAAIPHLLGFFGRPLLVVVVVEALRLHQTVGVLAVELGRVVPHEAGVGGDHRRGVEMRAGALLARGDDRRLAPLRYSFRERIKHSLQSPRWWSRRFRCWSSGPRRRRASRRCRAAAWSAGPRSWRRSRA